ncbi:MAG: reverse transcriptase/maturase family protein [bacterium]|nr:reverse transcriptase/maturase family protein [bacterium]
MRSDVMAWERSLEVNLFELRDELSTNRYKHGHYTPFTIHDPKERRIHKAGVRDRIVHQAVVNILERIFECQFIFDSFSCRKGKGIHAASKRLQKFLVKASKNYTRTVYALKCDIRKFFDRVDHNILLELIRRRIDDNDTTSLLTNIVASFNATSAKGLPIGNLTSQLFANIYLHELDYFVKHILREKWYLRYCDDFIIISYSWGHLLNILEKIKYFFRQRLKLEIHPNKVSIRSWGQGIDFVGYVHMPNCVIVRTKTKNRVLRRVNQKNLVSYMGVCNHADTFELQQLLFNKVGKTAKL